MPARKTMPLGDLVAAAFDEAARRCDDPREVSRWATKAVEQVLRRAKKSAVTRSILGLDRQRAKYLLSTS